MISLERINFHRIYYAWAGKGKEYVRKDDERIWLKDFSRLGSPFIIRYKNSVPNIANVIQSDLEDYLKKARADEDLNLLMKNNSSNKIDIGCIFGSEEKVGIFFSRNLDKIEPYVISERACQFYTLDFKS